MEEDDFRSGRFYKKWLRFNFIGMITMSVLGVGNLGFLIRAVILHEPGSAVISLMGVAISVWTVWHYPANQADVRRRWHDMDKFLADYDKTMENINQIQQKINK